MISLYLNRAFQILKTDKFTLKSINSIDSYFLKSETLWASLLATPQQVGIADLTLSTASDAVSLFCTVNYSGTTSSL
jgi:hypothetical protein